MKKNLLIAGIFLTLVFAGCSQETFQLMNLSESKRLVQNYYETGEFDRDCKAIIDDAISKIEKMKLDRNATVVFDIDETVLSNYEHTKEIGFGFVLELWNDWLKQADAKAIKETKRFYDWLISKKIKVVFLTGRYEETRDATIQNLMKEGFTSFDTLITRSAGEENIPAAEFKAAKRAWLTSKGYNIIACTGDQWSDLVGGNAGLKIKIPNYLYTLD